MRKTIVLLFGILLFFSSVTLKGQGLRFQSSAHLPINSRTSYRVLDNASPSFSDRLDIEFEMALYPVSTIGYVLRIKNQESDRTIYNLFFDGRGDNFFMFNEEGKRSKIRAAINLEKLIDIRWFTFRISFDMRHDILTLSINGEEFTLPKAGLPKTITPDIIFGRSDHIIDVPAFSIRNLRVGKGNRFCFPLSESEGTDVHNTKGAKIGSVQNPEWLINDSYYWKRRTSFQSQSVAGYHYIPSRKEILFFNCDTLYTYNVIYGTTQTKIFRNTCPLDLTLGMNFYNEGDGRIYAYEIFYDEAGSLPSVASFHPDELLWRVESYSTVNSQRHHHGTAFSASDSTLYIYGGFGSMRYSRDFCAYSLSTDTWRTLSPYTGDSLYCRYFSSLGYDASLNALYIYGGMGNESGEQPVGRYYFYDLHRLDLSTNTMTKLWEIPWKTTGAVPVRTMTLPDHENLFTLCYPESYSESHLNLYRFALKDGTYQQLGDSIPIRSDKIATNANLYFDKSSNEFYAAVQEFTDDIQSRLTIYTLAYPPITIEALRKYEPKNDLLYIWIGLGTAALLIVIGLMLYFTWEARRRQLTEMQNLWQTGLAGQAANMTPNAIYLFGDFTIRDRENRNITYMFGSKQMQALCLILEYSPDGGITSQKLSNLLWPDSSEEKAKNVRGVTINHLRKALEEVDGIELLFNNGTYKIDLAEEAYCDYLRCLEIITGGPLSSHNKTELIRIISRGKFLQFSEAPIFDHLKEQLEIKLEPVLLLELRASVDRKDYLSAIFLSDAIFNIDPVNDEAIACQVNALRHLHREEEAYVKYSAFVTQYKKSMGSDYPIPYKKL